MKEQKELLEKIIEQLSDEKAKLEEKAEDYWKNDRSEGYEDIMFIIEGYNRCLNYLVNVYHII